jgi:hypothetical protein
MACAHIVLNESYRTVAIGNVFEPCWSKAPVTTTASAATTAVQNTQHSPRYFPATTAGTWNSYLNETETSSVHTCSAINDSIDAQLSDDKMLQCSNGPKHVDNVGSESQPEATAIQSAQDKVMRREHLHSF